MLILLLVLSLFNAEAREWTLPPLASFGSMEGAATSAEIPRYKKESLEHKILQIALDIENILPSYIDPKYEKVFLSNIPKLLHKNFKKRNKIYIKVQRLKKKGRAVESETGYLEPASNASPGEKEIIETENEYRKEQFNLISLYLKIKSKKKEMMPLISKICAQAIKYQKYYALVDTGSPIKPKESKVLTSMASSYKYKTVWKELLATLKEEKFTVKDKDIDKKKGKIVPRYKCNGEERNFILELCAVKNKKLLNCKHSISKEKYLYASINNGTMIWIEKGKGKTLYVTNSLSSDQEIMLCQERKLDVLEKLSMKLISADRDKATKNVKKK